MKTIPQLHLTTGKDDLRPLFMYVKVDKEFVVATDAHTLVYFKTEDVFEPEFIEGFPQESFLVHGEDWAKFKGADLITWHGEDMIEIAYTKKRNVFIKIELETSLGTYPKWKAVIPSMNELEPVKLDQIGINANLLVVPQKILNTVALCCTFYGQNRAIEVLSNDPDIKGKAIIMPVRISDELLLTEKK